MKNILKKNWLLILISELLALACAIFSTLVLPFQRNQQKTASVLFILGYTITLILSIFLIWILFRKIKKEQELTNKKANIFALVFYFSTILLISIIVTIIFVIIKLVNPNSIILVQGILSFILAIIGFLLLLLPIEININFIN